MKLQSFSAIRRGNYLLKLSKQGSNFLLIAYSVEDDSKTYVRFFTNPYEADIFIETLIEKDIYG